MSQSNGTGELAKSKRQIKSEAKRSLGLIKDKLRFLQKAVGRHSDFRVATVPISALLNVGHLLRLLGDNALSDNLRTELLRTHGGYDTNAKQQKPNIGPTVPPFDHFRACTEP